ncbi:MAG: preQ(1) synthase [Kiritimatiellia bacterium]
MASPRAGNGLTLLGSGSTKYPTDYAPQVLEAFDNRHPERDYLVTLRCPEFTSLCPITSQPDFADITIRYIPDKRLVESKSLKLYLFSFRNHGDFHEDCVNTILSDLLKLMSPKYIEVFGEFRPRGGIAIHPLATYGKPRTRYAKLAAERLTRG